MKLISKFILALIITVWTGSSLYANSICLHFLQMKPYLGVVSKTESSGLVLSIGPYFGSGHKQIVQSLMQQKNLSVEGLVWAGELMMSPQGRGFVIHRANETSGYLHELNTNPSKKISADPWDTSGDLRSVYTLKSNLSFLDFFRGHKDLIFSSDYLAEVYKPTALHLLPELNSRSENFRHDLDNEMSGVFSWLYFFGVGRDVSQDEIRRIRQGLIKLVDLTETYLKWGNDETQTEKIRQDLKLFLRLSNQFLTSSQSQLYNDRPFWLKVEAQSKVAYHILFNSEQKPILYQFSVN